METNIERGIGQIHVEKETGRQTYGENKREKVKTSSRFMTLWSRLHGVRIGDGGKRVVCVSLLWKKEELSRWIYIIQPVTEQHFQQRQTTGVATECLFLSFHVESSPSWLLWNLLGEAKIMWLSISGPCLIVSDPHLTGSCALQWSSVRAAPRCTSWEGA